MRASHVSHQFVPLPLYGELPPNEQDAALAHYASASVAGKDKPWQVRHYWPERQRVLRHLLLAGPDAQVC